MVIKKKDRVIEPSTIGKIWDYPIGNAPVGISFQEYDGRAPKTGQWINTVCWEAYYIIRGSADVFVDNEHHTVEAGDVVVINPGQKTYLVAHHMVMLTITNPNWYSEQFREVE